MVGDFVQSEVALCLINLEKNAMRFQKVETTAREESDETMIDDDGFTRVSPRGDLKPISIYFFP